MDALMEGRVSLFQGLCGEIRGNPVITQQFTPHLLHIFEVWAHMWDTVERRSNIAQHAALASQPVGLVLLALWALWVCLV